MAHDEADPRRPATSPWWRHAVFYEVYVRSFLDTDGDGVGDIPGITARLDYLAKLGVDALWVTPFYRSPMVDHGYDVADYRSVDPVFGTVADVEALVAAAHRRDIKVMLDIVPNHTSDQHEWFRAALASASGSPERDRYVFRDGRGPDGSQPPNNWPSIFAPSAWTRVPDGQWYLHLFAPEQPDLNWRNPKVMADMATTLRFWLDRGVDGFRFDVAHAMAKPEGLPDLPENFEAAMLDDATVDVRFNNEGVHELHRQIRAVLDDYQHSSGRTLASVGEVWERDPVKLSRFIRPDELHLTFNFSLLVAAWDAAQFRRAIDSSIESVDLQHGTATWVLSNHDKPRMATRYGNGALGLRRARAAALLQLALPGVPFVYYGDELGMPDVPVSDADIQDPQWLRSGGTEPTRDPCRTPLPWSGDQAPYGFTAVGSHSWLPMPLGWRELTVAAQDSSPRSTLTLYRRAIELRRQHPGLAAAAGPGLTWMSSAPMTLAFRRPYGLCCVVNMGTERVPLPSGDVLLRSDLRDGRDLPPDTGAWVQLAD